MRPEHRASADEPRRVSQQLSAGTVQPPWIEPQFIDNGKPALSRRFVVIRRAQINPCQGLVIHAPAFAEEMNKSRRMVAQQSAQLAAAGFTVVQIDLLGCGDSDGEFGDATWQTWIDDLLLACRIGREHEPSAPLWLWGLRAGCLLATEAAQALAEPCKLLLWQPSLSGAAVLQQFLRLRAAADMLGQGGKGVVDQLKARLGAGESVEVAGYVVGAALAQALQQARLTPSALVSQVEWLELADQADAPWSPAAATAIARWRGEVPRLQTLKVVGPQFWQTVEIEDAPALWAASCAALLGTGTGTTAAAALPVGSLAPSPPA